MRHSECFLWQTPFKCRFNRGMYHFVSLIQWELFIFRAFSRNELKKSKFLPLISAKVAFKTAMHDKIYLGRFGGNNISRATVVFSTAFGSRLILLLAQGLGLMPLMSVQFTFKVCCLSVSRMEMCLVILLMNLSSVYAFNSNYNPGIFIKSNYIESTLFIICKMLVFILQIGKYEDLLTC